MIRDLGLNSNTSWRCHGHIVKPHLRKANDRISTKLTSIWEYIWPLSLLFTKTSYTTLYPRFCVSNQIRNHQKISNMSECWLNIYYIKILIGLFKIFQNIVIPGVLWWWAHWLPLHGHPLQSISLQLNGHKLFENKSSSLQNLSNITASDTYANPLNLQFITKSFQYNSFWYLCQSINLQFITKCFQYNESSLYDRLLLSTFDSKNKWTDNHHIAN